MGTTRKNDRSGIIYYNNSLKNTARTLRKNMTDSERSLWSRIRRKQLKGFQFYRQKTVGNYIVDFYCPSGGIIVEVDGSQHYQERERNRDKIRDAYLSKLGFRVLRFPNWEVMNELEDVVESICAQLPSAKSPSVPL
jgi:very-short-patch-repair endonuclease